MNEKNKHSKQETELKVAEYDLAEALFTVLIPEDETVQYYNEREKGGFKVEKHFTDPEDGQQVTISYETLLNHSTAQEEFENKLRKHKGLDSPEEFRTDEFKAIYVIKKGSSSWVFSPQNTAELSGVTFSSEKQGSEKIFEEENLYEAHKVDELTNMVKRLKPANTLKEVARKAMSLPGLATGALGNGKDSGPEIDDELQDILSKK